MKFSLTWPVEDDVILAPDALSGQLGETIPVNVGDWSTEGVIVAVKVADDGGSFDVTIEVDNDLDVEVCPTTGYALGNIATVDGRWVCCGGRYPDHITRDPDVTRGAGQTSPTST